MVNEDMTRGIEDPIFGDLRDTEGDANGEILIGGMAKYDEERMAMSYKAAADMLVEGALHSGDRSWEVAAPILYLYRHTLELYLKWAVQPKKKNHKLPVLIGKASQIAKERTGEKLPQWANDRMLELADFDSRSTAFRYAESDEPKQDLESLVDLYHLRHIMDYLTAGLGKLAGMKQLGEVPDA